MAAYYDFLMCNVFDDCAVNCKYLLGLKKYFWIESSYKFFMYDLFVDHGINEKSLLRIEQKYSNKIFVWMVDV